MCDLKLLDLVTHIDNKVINDMIGYDGKVCRTRAPTRGKVWLIVQRAHHIPSVEELSETIKFSPLYYTYYNYTSESCKFFLIYLIASYFHRNVFLWW